MTDLLPPSQGVPNEQTPQETTAPPQAQVAPEAAPVVRDDVPPVQGSQHRALHSDKQTPGNTPMQDVQPSISEIIRELTNEDREKRGSVNVFLGNSKESQIYIAEITSRWMAYEYVRNNHKIEKATDSQLSKAEQDWAEYVTESLPGKTVEEASNYAADLFSYATEIQDGIRIRTKMMGEEGISNVSDRGGIIRPDIFGKKAGPALENFTLSQMMSRTASRDAESVLQWTILLRNSFVVLNIERPSRMDIGVLLNNIRRTLGGYVREIGSNNLTLASVAARRVLWNFLCKHMVSSSVTDIGDYGQLAEVILGPDLDVLIIGLLEAYTEKGVQHYLGCLASGCGWGQYALTSPANMVRIRHKIQSPEDAAVYANLVNGHLKLTRAETLAYSRASTYGLESNRIYSPNKGIYLEATPPTLLEEFNTFDYFIGEFNPRLAELRQTITDPEEYQAEVALAYANLGATEFVQWIHAFVKVAPSDSDGKEVRYVRDGTNDNEFNKGLMKVLTDDTEWNKSVVSFVLNRAPYMSRTFVGVRNYICPKCGANSADTQDPQGLLERKLGYTPINVVYSFFIHTQLYWMATSSDLESHKQEALS